MRYGFNLPGRILGHQRTAFGKHVSQADGADEQLKLCGCVDKGPWPFDDVSFSPLSELLPDRCIPELRRLQAELGARHSFREAARLLHASAVLAADHASVRNRLHRVAGELHAKEARAVETSPASETATVSDPGIVVMIDGAHIRAAPGYQTRYVDVTVGKVEAAGRLPRRFALAPSGTERPLLPFRAALAVQGWRPDVPVTVISDGEAALPELVRKATGSDVTHILDWCELFGVRHLASEAVYLNSDRLRAAVTRFLSRCDDLRSYLANNETGLIDYGSRHRAGLPVSTSRAEDCVDEIANARRAKRRRMRWSPHGAHRVAVVRAAVLDSRLTPARVLSQAA